MTTDLLDRLETLYRERAGSQYHGEAVTELEHALQAATLAEQDAQPAACIAAALLHDIGHLVHGYGEDCADRGIDDRHEELGVRYLAGAFGPEVTEPIRLHVQAKRYLSAVDPVYASLLSPASVKSMHLQGGPMSPAEVAAFDVMPHRDMILAVRRYDDRAKVPNLPTEGFGYFRKYLEACVRG